jgi:tetratricopeptide (TPR) repeat protein
MKLIVTLGVLVLSLWAEAASGQLFRSEDLHRPLIPRRLPPGEIYADMFPHLDKIGVRRYRSLLKAKWSVFPVQNRDAWGRGIYIADLMQAVIILDEDPYAWHLLGAYYALSHELTAATEANREALTRIEKLRRERGDAVANRFLGDLEFRCRANLSRLLTSQDQPKEALVVLGERLPDDVDPILRHALITAGVLAFLEVGEIPAADGLIAQGETEQLSSRPGIQGNLSENERAYLGFDNLRLYDLSYPQFGSRWKEQTLPYLRARRHYAAGLYKQAVDGLRAFDVSPERAKFWEARFLLGLAQWKVGNLVKGADVLGRLLRDLPRTMRGRPKGKMQRIELLWYNLGLLHEEMNEQPPLEGYDYQKALALAIDRDCRNFKELREIESAAKCNQESICASLEGQAGFLVEEMGLEEVVPGCKHVCKSNDRSSSPVPIDGVAERRVAERLLCQALAFEPFSAAFNNLGLLYLRRARETKEFAAANPTIGTNITPNILLGKAERVLRTGLVGVDPTQHWRLRLNLVLVELERSAYDAAVSESRIAVEESPEHKMEAAALLAEALHQNKDFRSNETALSFFLDLANQLISPEMPDYLTSVLEPMASGAPGWTHLSKALRDRAAALLRSRDRLPGK